MRDGYLLVINPVTHRFSKCSNDQFMTMVLKGFVGRAEKNEAKCQPKNRWFFVGYIMKTSGGSLRFLKNWNPGHSFGSELFFKELEHAVL
jgi:hypothetical protein